MVKNWRYVKGHKMCNSCLYGFNPELTICPRCDTENKDVSVPSKAQELKEHEKGCECCKVTHGCGKTGSVNPQVVAEIVSGGGAPKLENTVSQEPVGCDLKSEVSPPVASRLNERSASTQVLKEDCNIITELQALFKSTSSFND